MRAHKRVTSHQIQQSMLFDKDEMYHDSPIQVNFLTEEEKEDEAEYYEAKFSDDEEDNRSS